MAQTESASFRLQVVSEPRNRDVQDISLPPWMDQRTLWDDRSNVAQDGVTAVHRAPGAPQLKTSFAGDGGRQPLPTCLCFSTAATVVLAQMRLLRFDRTDHGCLLMIRSWQRRRPRIVPFFAWLLEILNVIYTTDTVASRNMRLR